VVAPVVGAEAFPAGRPVVVVPVVAAERFPAARPVAVAPVVGAEAFPAGRPVVVVPVVAAVAFPAWDACKSRNPGRMPYRARRSSGDSRSSSARLTDSPPA
jgi:hypothetical protein